MHHDVDTDICSTCITDEPKKMLPFNVIQIAKESLRSRSYNTISSQLIDSIDLRDCLIDMIVTQTDMHHQSVALL